MLMFDLLILKQELRLLSDLESCVKEFLMGLQNNRRTTLV
jgi:hypothetical protein